MFATSTLEVIQCLDEFVHRKRLQRGLKQTYSIWMFPAPLQNTIIYLFSNEFFSAIPVYGIHVHKEIVTFYFPNTSTFLLLQIWYETGIFCMNPINSTCSDAFEILAEVFHDSLWLPLPLLNRLNGIFFKFRTIFSRGFYQRCGRYTTTSDPVLDTQLAGRRSRALRSFLPCKWAMFILSFSFKPPRAHHKHSSFT